MKLSFVIPAYNAVDTLPRCLSSIYSLPLSEEDFEVVVIDDCSTDDTLSYLYGFSRSHSNMHVLHQEVNHRQGAARNRGLREAKGKYVMFVDADDVVETGVPDAVDWMVKNNTDVVFCNYLWMYSSTNIERRSLSLKDGYTTSGKDFCEQYYDTIINTCPISYIWVRDYLLTNGVPFLEDRRMEDFDWIERNLYRAKTVGYTGSIIYRVMTFENVNSTTHTCSPETSADWVHVGYRRMLFCDEINHESPEFAKKIEYQSRCFVGNTMKIRNLSKFSPCGVIELKKRIGRDAFVYLINKEGWSRETNFCLRHIYLVACAELVIYPIAVLVRTAIRNMRRMIIRK